MDPRRSSRVIDPKVRKVGFFAPGPPPDRTQSGPAASPPASNSLSPVMIPPTRHASDNLSRAVGVPVPTPSQGRRSSIDHVPIGSYNPQDSVLGTSPVSSRIGDGEFSEDSVNWIRRTNSGKLPMSLPSNGIGMMVEANLALGVKKATGLSNDEKGGGPVAEMSLQSKSKPLKEKTTKAERRALQEAQRAAKAAAKGSNGGCFLLAE